MRLWWQLGAVAAGPLARRRTQEEAAGLALGGGCGRSPGLSLLTSRAAASPESCCKSSLLLRERRVAVAMGARAGAAGAARDAGCKSSLAQGRDAGCLQTDALQRKAQAAAAQLDAPVSSCRVSVRQSLP
jgi:hypothetical protein